MFEKYIVVGVIFGLMIVLYRDAMRPVVAFLLANIIFLISGINESIDVLSGFANEQLMVILLLLIVSDVIQKTNAIEIVFSNFFRDGISLRGFLSRMVPSVTGVSGFINNTPLVAMLLPYVNHWAVRNKLSPSKVLIPLSFATIIGGTLTLVGTSTNLVVNGFVEENKFKPLGMFDFTIPGIAVAVIGILYLIIFSPKILPNRKSPIQVYTESKREYLSELIVSKSSLLIGKSIEEAGLRNLKGTYLVEIIRENEIISAVGPETKLFSDDILIFAGEISTLSELVKKNNGLLLSNDPEIDSELSANVIECIVSPDSSLIGKTVKSANFRSRFDASIIAVNRGENRLKGKIGEIKIQSGDLLLILAGSDFDERLNTSHDIYVVSKVQKNSPVPIWKSIALFIGLVSAFVLASLGILTLFKGLLLLICVIVFLNVVKYNELSKNVDFDLYFVLALALGLGKAISNSQLDKAIAHQVSNWAFFVSSLPLVLLLVYIITNVLAILVTNKAAVAIMFPVTVQLIQILNIENPVPFFLAIAFAGSAEFMTPYGYQTNLMVYGPGGYKFKDYIKFGWPLTLLYTITVVSVLSLLYGLF